MRLARPVAAAAAAPTARSAEAIATVPPVIAASVAGQEAAQPRQPAQQPRDEDQHRRIEPPQADDEPQVDRGHEVRVEQAA